MTNGIGTVYVRFSMELYTEEDISWRFMNVLLKDRRFMSSIFFVFQTNFGQITVGNKDSSTVTFKVFHFFL